MEKDQKILIGLIIFVFLVASSIIVYLFAIKKDISSDAILFKKEYEELNDKYYEASKDKFLKVKIESTNLYVYKSDEDILDVIENEDAIIYFGYAKCSYCRNIVGILNDVAKDKGIKKIYYVDISNIRDSYEIIDKTVAKITNGTSSYYKLMEVLDDYLSDYYIKDSNGEKYNTGVKRLYAPTVAAIKDKKVIGFYEGPRNETKHYKKLSESKSEELRKTFEKIINDLNSDICLTSGC